MTKLYFKTAYRSLRFKDALADVETYCMFVGYPRSGHTLFGSLLDAHPHMIIAHEADALKYIQAGFSQTQIFALLLERSRDFADSGSVWSGYSYKVPNQWNGRFEKLRIIGDKKGGRSSKRLTANPELLSLLQNTIRINLKLVHVVRNPYDNISTICRRSRHHDLGANIDVYFSLCETNARIKKKVDSHNFIDVRLESMIENPRRCLTELCRFLGVEPCNDYLEACGSIVFASPHKSRHDVEWSDASRERVRAQIERFPFLYGYHYDD